MSQAEKKSQITESQKNYLIEFMKRNTDLQSGKFSNNFTCKDAQRKWSELGDILNSMPVASRDWKGWRKTWQDLKSRTKVKISQKTRHARGTGGGPPIEGELTTTEESILDIVKVVSIEGHKEAAESAVEYNFDEVGVSNEEENEQPDLEFINKATLTPATPIPKKKMSTLKYTVDAVNNFKEGMDAKLALKEKYYAEKIELLKVIANAKQIKAEAAERIASASERIATALEGLESLL